MSDVKKAIVFEEGNMRAVATWYPEGPKPRWILRCVQLELRDEDAMGQPHWSPMGDEMRAASATSKRETWLYCVLINRAEKWLKENP